MDTKLRTYPTKKAQLLQAIMGDVWLITELSANAYLPFIMAAIEGNIKQMEAFRGEVTQLLPVAVHQGERKPIEEALPNSTALIEIHGALTKYDGWCNYGMESIGEWVKQADCNSNINEIVFIVDSPGGQASGTEELSNIIASTQKKTMAWINGQVASAAYFGIVGCDRIKLSSQSTLVGSIGTAFSTVDYRPYLKKQGYKFHDLRATKSTGKNQEAIDMLNDKPERFIKNLLDPLNEVFITQVEKYRDVQQEALTGKVYFGQSAIDAGLADSIGTLEDAIQEVKELSIKHKNEVTMGFFSDIFNKKKEEANAQGKVLSAEELEQAAEQEIQKITLEKQKAEEQLEALELALNQSKEQQNKLQEKNKELTQKQAALEKENEELGKKTTTQAVQIDKNKDVYNQENNAMPLLDIEEKIIQRGGKINDGFERIRGLNV